MRRARCARRPPESARGSGRGGAGPRRPPASGSPRPGRPRPGWPRPAGPVPRWGLPRRRRRTAPTRRGRPTRPCTPPPLCPDLRHAAAGPVAASRQRALDDLGQGVPAAVVHHQHLISAGRNRRRGVPGRPPGRAAVEGLRCRREAPATTADFRTPRLLQRRVRHTPCAVGSGTRSVPDTAPRRRLPRRPAKSQGLAPAIGTIYSGKVDLNEGTAQRSIANDENEFWPVV